MIYATVTVKVCTEKCGWSRPITCELTCDDLPRLWLPVSDYVQPSHNMHNVEII